MIVIESHNMRYRAVVKPSGSAIEVAVFDRGHGRTRGVGAQIMSSTFLRRHETLAEIRAAVHNFLLSMPDSTKNEPA